MQLESKKYLFDVIQAANKVKQFTRDKSFLDYENDELLRSGVERQFEIMGEALNQLSKVEPERMSDITDYKKIISFRNILIHAYADIDDRLVWNILDSKLSVLLEEVQQLLDE